MAAVPGAKHRNLFRSVPRPSPPPLQCPQGCQIAVALAELLKTTRIIAQESTVRYLIADILA